MIKNSYKPRVLWLTNLPAPYRFPIWTRMAQFTDIKIAFLLGEKNWRNWRVPEGQTWKHQFLQLRSLNIKEYDFIPSMWGAKKLLQDIDVMVLGGWETPFYIRSMLVAKKKKIQVIQFYESTADSHRIDNFIIRRVRSFLFSKADFIVTIGKASSKAVENMGVASQKIVTLFNPVDVDWFNMYSKNHRVQDSSGHRYIYVGQLIERKNISVVIKSFAAVRKNLDTLTIVGDGPLARELRNLATSLGIAESVSFVGQVNQEELGNLYARSNTLILASTNEVWGLVVNEALASGLHVVVSIKCGVSEFVGNMNGVYTCSTDQISVQKSMKKSSLDWNGHIDQPEIIEYTPDRFADKFVEIIRAIDLKSNSC